MLNFYVFILGGRSNDVYAIFAEMSSAHEEQDLSACAPVNIRKPRKKLKLG